MEKPFPQFFEQKTEVIFYHVLLLKCSEATARCGTEKCFGFCFYFYFSLYFCSSESSLHAHVLSSSPPPAWRRQAHVFMATAFQHQQIATFVSHHIARHCAPTLHVYPRYIIWARLLSPYLFIQQHLTFHQSFHNLMCWIVRRRKIGVAHILFITCLHNND